jgi:hypothetical protein
MRGAAGVRRGPASGTSGGSSMTAPTEGLVTMGGPASRATGIETGSGVGGASVRVSA